MTQSYSVNKNGETNRQGVHEAGVRLISSSSSSNFESESTVLRKEMGVEKDKLEKIEIGGEERCKLRCIHWTKVVWAFIILWVSVADVTVIIYLSYVHFHHSADIQAWLMLLPILMNFIGIFTFLSE